MLVSFSVANFRSFSTEQLFSLAASTQLGEAHAAHVVPAGECGGVLRTGVIYGATAAGRSSLHKALAFVKDTALLQAKGPGTGRTAFGHNGMSSLPSTFDLQFLQDGKLYRYGFSANSERITEEWLAQTVSNQERPIYQRRTLGDGRVEISAPGLMDHPKLATLAAAGVEPAESFLASACRQLKAAELGGALSDAIEWFAMGLSLLTPDSTPGLLGQSLANDARFREFAGHFLRSCGTGIEGIQVQQETLSREELYATLPASLITYLFGQRGPYQASIPLPDDAELLVESTGSGLSFHRLAIKTTHRNPGGGVRVLALSEESGETRRLLALVPALYQCSKGAAVFCIDEIDRGLPPPLVQKVLEYFLTTSGEHPCQIIATTHDTQLLSRDLLRRDEIWFMEKDARGASHLYSLMDWKIDPGLARGHSPGRHGSPPFATGFEQLLENPPETVDCHS